MTTASQLFDRNVALTVTFDDNESLQWTDLRVSFDVTHTNNRDPSPGEFHVWNLNNVSRERMKHAIGVTLEAGYGGRFDQVFIGRVTRTEMQRTPTDVETILFAADGIDILAEKNIAVALSPGTPYTFIFEKVQEALGVTTYYVDTSLLQGQTLNGVVMVGPAGYYMDQLASRFGATWSIVDGQLQFLADRQPNLSSAVLVTPATGLVGSPELITRKRRGGRVETTGLQWTMLLQGKLRPGQLFQVDAKDYQGYYVAQKVQHRGDNGWDQTYHTVIEATEKKLRAT